MAGILFEERLSFCYSDIVRTRHLVRPRPQDQAPGWPDAGHRSVAEPAKPHGVRRPRRRFGL